MWTILSPLEIPLLLAILYSPSTASSSPYDIFGNDVDLDAVAQKIREEFNERTADLSLWDTKETRIGENELLCYCNEHCDSNLVHVLGKEYGWVCRARPGGRCRKVIHTDRDGHLLDYSFSCVPADQLHPPERPFICAPFNRSGTVSQVECCSSGPFCNYSPLPEPNPNEKKDGTKTYWNNLLVYFGVAVLFSAIGLSVGIYCERPKQYLRRKSDWLLDRSSILVRRGRKPSLSRLDKLLDDLEMTVSSGSGAGMPLLAQRTIARQITLDGCIGRGGFGEVYVGEWRGEKVAVKIFLSRDEPSWQRETEIYRTNMLRHSNLLRWIASDNKDTGASTQLWLITEWLPNGSLYDYLEGNGVDPALCLQFIRSVAHGLAYLHHEVAGLNNQYSKPGVAHRDLKSKNILIKSDMTCAIADLGLAVRCKNGVIDLPLESTRGGTIRYMAPEALSNSFVGKSFNGYLQMDVYAFALVMWEIAMRVDLTVSERQQNQQQPHSQLSTLAPHEVPYWEYVPREPGIEDMRQCVVTNQRRPSIPTVWSSSPITSELTRIIKECWASNPNSRLTSLNIRYSIDNLIKAQELNITTT